jgi:hypothetical protein
MYPSHALSRRVSPQRVIILLLGLFLALAWTSPAFSAPDKWADAEALTHSLVGLNTAYQKAAPAAKAQALQQLIDATVERQAMLAELVKTDPGAVLRTAIPARVRKGMPAEVQAFIEQRLELEGELEVMYEDYADGSYRLRHTLKANGERISLHFKSPPPGLLSGTPARVSGVLVDNAMAVESGEDGILMLALDGGPDGGTNGGTVPELPNTLGEQRTLVLLVNFQDDPFSEPWTQAEAADVVFGQTNDFFLENSTGLTWLSGDVHGWYTIPVDSTTCDIAAIEEHGNQAAIADGVDLASYQRIAYFHTRNGCGWSGVASLGGEPTRALMNGTIDPKIVGHEFGHTLGLDHAHGLECGSETLGTNCENWEYADSLDIMGSKVAHFNAFHKERLGWLGSEQILTIETNGSYALEPYSAPQATDPKTLKILKDMDPVTGLRTWYYVEYRQAIGFDHIIVTDPAFNSDNILNGVVIRIGTESDEQSSNMLDMTPGSDLIFDWFDSALTVGQSYTDSGAGITITTNWTNSSGASVNVALEPQAPVCVPANPTLSLSPGESDWVAPGTAVNYSVTVTNHDSAACGMSTFNLDAAIASGWNADFSQSALTIEHGASASATLAVASPLTATDGFYPIDVSASNSTKGAFTATGAVTHVVSAPVEPPANNPPVALDDSIILVSKSAINIAVLANDSDPDGDYLTISTFSNGAKGAVSYNADGTLTYTPAKRFKSSDSFSYTVSDGENTASATVSITLQTSGGGGGGRGKPKK